MSTQKIRRMIKQEYPDAQLENTGSGHIRVRTNGVIVIVSASPSDVRVMQNFRGDVRRQMRRLECPR